MPKFSVTMGTEPAVVNKHIMEESEQGCSTKLILQKDLGGEEMEHTEKLNLQEDDKESNPLGGTTEEPG